SLERWKTLCSESTPARHEEGNKRDCLLCPLYGPFLFRVQRTHRRSCASAGRMVLRIRYGIRPQEFWTRSVTRNLLPMLTVDMENKENGSLDVKNSVENGRPPDPADWAVIDVVNYFRTAGFEEQASAFQEQVLDLLHLDPSKAVLTP
uniref:Sterile alpha motif domain containing 13 n=1 Tax=Anser cygnoides TaxID=8845 RepID=A0A8B9ESM3_ANSCY